MVITALDEVPEHLLDKFIAEAVTYLDVVDNKLKAYDFKDLDSSKEGVDIPELIKSFIDFEGTAHPKKDIKSKYAGASLSKLHVSYKDSKQIRTIGYGFNINDKANRKFLSDLGLDPNKIKLISEEQAQLLLKYSISNAIKDVKKSLPDYDKLTKTQKHVVIDMMFNLGYNEFNEFSEFKKDIQANNIQGAIDNMRYKNATTKAEETPYWVGGKRRPKALAAMLEKEMLEKADSKSSPNATKLEPGVYQDEAGNLFTVDKNGISSRQAN